MRVYGYVRVSTDEQAKEGISLPAQTRQIGAYADLARVRGDQFELVRIIRDDGASAKTLDRPGMAEVLDLMRSGECQGLIVAKLDRLTRNLGDWTYLITSFFGERGTVRTVRLFSVAEEVNTTKASGRMMLNILMTIAQWEREIIAERTREALAEKIKLGERCGKVRYGYDLDVAGPYNEDGLPIRLIENAAEQAAIRLMKELRGGGHSLRAIAEALRALGIETKEGNDLWLPATIDRILKRTG